MKNALLALCTFVLAACAGRGAVAPVPAETPFVNTDAVMQLIGKYTMAHACPVEGRIFTAAHVTRPFSENSSGQTVLASYAWSDRLGLRGLLKPYMVNQFRDLAIMTPVSGDTPVYYKHAQEEPIEGDTLIWVEYDNENSLDKKVITAEFVRTIAGHLVADTSPVPGASGGCAFNAEGEVVGVISWALPNNGIAVSLAGPWWP